MISEKYDPKAIEGKWQHIWEEAKAFETPDPKNDPKKRPKYYCLCMFPYPSGSIHMGHVRNYSIGDVISRFKRMQGFNVLQPIGWDSFGLPAENAAIQRGVPPRDWTLQNISQMKAELKSMGFAYDWNREVTTCLPEYFKWEQLFFRRFYEEGLAYKKTGQVNWCEPCQTVLANEQVQEGKCWRCDSVVIQKELSQWYLKITNYADQLLSGHEQLKGHWPEQVLEMQKHWIGESHGARIQFPLDAMEGFVEVFTTRADTLFGVTFVTIAAAHPLAEKLIGTDLKKREVLEALKKEVAGRAREAQVTEKKGFFTGGYATHPFTGEKIPVWVGNFVVMDYGTGAVMGVPAHDARDFEFATTFQLPVKPVIRPTDCDNVIPLKEAFTELGVLIDSAQFSGMPSETAKINIAKALEQKQLGQGTIQYRLRDWGISRQRYWGAPVPIVYCDKCGVVLVPEAELPVTLPLDIQFTGLKGNPLEHHPTWKHTACPKCHEPARRETDTMDTFVESSWYYARFTGPSATAPFKKESAESWLPVDCYIGGIEHACMHLLYARFFHKVLRDWKYLSGDEPFQKLLTQGMVIKDGSKMSKSKGNVVTPASIIERFGADTARLFSLFAAPPEKDLDWNDKGVEGCHRFLNRVWRLFYQFQGIMTQELSSHEELKLSNELTKVRRKTHWTIKKMTEDIESQKFNTAISAAMELVNEIYGALDQNASQFDSSAGKFVVGEALKALVLLLAPYAPHLSEELWRASGQVTLVSEASWPKFLPELLTQETFMLVVQVNGKVREKLEMPKGLTKEEIQAQILQLPKLQQFLQGKTVKQFIYVPERIANVVVV